MGNKTTGKITSKSKKLIDPQTEEFDDIVKNSLEIQKERSRITSTYY